MYNMIFGQSANAPILLELLGLTPDDFYRYRDCYLDERGNIAVYTRGGGGNRHCWCEGERTVEFAGEMHSPDCVILKQSANRKHPCYLYDEDDDFDSTYATFYFKMPDEAKEAIKDIPSEISRDEAWQLFIQALKEDGGREQDSHDET